MDDIDGSGGDWWWDNTRCGWEKIQKEAHRKKQQLQQQQQPKKKITKNYACQCVSLPFFIIHFSRILVIELLLLLLYRESESIVFSFTLLIFFSVTHAVVCAHLSVTRSPLCYFRVHWFIFSFLKVSRALKINSFIIQKNVNQSIYDIFLSANIWIYNIFLFLNCCLFFFYFGLIFFCFPVFFLSNFVCFTQKKQRTHTQWNEKVFDIFILSPFKYFIFNCSSFLIISRLL